VPPPAPSSTATGDDDDDVLQGPPEHIPKEWVPVLAREAQLFLDHPFMIAGDERTDTDIMVAANRRGPRLVAKVGGEAVHGTGLLTQGWGIAVKIADGDFRALPPVLVEALDQIGTIRDILDDERSNGPAKGYPSLLAMREPAVTNMPGQTVGRIRPCFQMNLRLSMSRLRERGLAPFFL
jgi:L-asparaginase II